MTKIKIDPVNRVEGHLQIELVVENKNVVEASAMGPMFRGIEIILKGRHPLDATRITQRICGVCPTSHSLASARCLDSALGIAEKIPPDAKILRNLILGCNFLQSHILHFFHLAALDYVDLRYGVDLGVLKENWGPFFPQYKSDYKLDKNETLHVLKDYLEALKIRRQTHELQAIFGGKMPHQVGIVAGGVAQKPTVDKIADFRFRLKNIISFIKNSYLPDVLLVAQRYPEYWDIGKSYGEFLAYGAMDGLFCSGVVIDGKLHSLNVEEISESVKYSRYKDNGTLHPREGRTEPYPGKESAYSWIKAPRYQGRPKEVGPLARMVVNYYSANPRVIGGIQELLKKAGKSMESFNSVLGRHAARVLETLLVAQEMEAWLLKLDGDKEAFEPFKIPREAEGMGLVEAPRGALGHWIKIKDGVIENYQCVVPTTWNASPRDDRDQPGPMEAALFACPVADEDNPVEPLRVVRSFDPCLACAVHLLNLKGKRREYRVL